MGREETELAETETRRGAEVGVGSLGAGGPHGMPPNDPRW